MRHSLFFLFLFSLAACSGPYYRDSEIEVGLGADPVGSPAYWGPEARDADHGRVAIDDNCHVLVTQHTTRRPAGVPYDLLQVELAFYEYQNDGLPDDWFWEERHLIGSIDHDPLGIVGISQTKCERPAIIELGVHFFVVWTRRYDTASGVVAAEDEPAVLECAWVYWDGVDLIINNGGAPAGQGYVLDSNYLVRECGGVPDCVEIQAREKDGVLTAAVVYPRQTDFSLDVSAGTSDNTREFELALVTCELELATDTITSEPPFLLYDDIQVDGFTLPGGGNAAILVIPDLAPSSEDEAFWLTFESQVMGPYEGTINLDYWKKESGIWTKKASELYNSSTTTTKAIRKRPKASAFPGDVPGEEQVTLVFNHLEASASPDPDVYYNELSYDPATSAITQSLSPVTFDFTNTIDREYSPIPTHGPSSATFPKLRRAYYELTGAGIDSYDQTTDLDADVSTSISAVRAYAIYSDVFSTPLVAVTWEDGTWTDPVTAMIYTRVVLKMLD